MTITKHISSFTVLVLLVFAANAQTSAASNKEVVSKRDMYSKTYLKENGDYEAIIHAAPIHFQKNGVWEEINTTLVSSEGAYKNETNSIQSYFPANISGTEKIKLIVNGTNEIFISAQKKFVYADGTFDRFISISDSENSTSSVRDNSVEYTYDLINCTDAFTVLNGEIKNNTVLNQFPNAMNGYPKSGYLGIQEIMELPDGWKIITADKSDLALTSSSLFILDASGNHVLTIPAPVVFDKKGLQSDGANSTQAKYIVRQHSFGFILTTLVPVEWLKDENTEYPVTIDPTVTIPGTTGGWQSPNNWVDNPAFVFIGVCCSNLTHRAWIKFNVSSIPTTQCILTVELQVNVITVVAATPELTHITDVTGAFGPYGGIVPAAYNDFGGAIYNSFTINGTGLYGYYNLGATANTILQSQLAGGWFQTAFMLNNEPSTNYKIMSATTSNLRVTYNTCVLPIELRSFDATCNNGKVNLTWETASQLNNDFFTVERTSDGIKYETIGAVTGEGNGNQPRYYSFVDANPLEGTAYYMLKQTDIDGRSEKLSSVAVNCDDVVEFTVYPNPGTGIFSLEGAQKNNELVITDVLGQIVFQTKITGEKTQLDLSNQLNGVYFVQIISKNGLASRKVIISK
ncbi:MAG: T9SS type A sorting domain-containing protein [Flavobacteriales bacterium]